ncbi:7-carboxy-7-deazaguanine synthase QueE [Streptomyces sp. PKU-EA00015]|uniref:7-carboxy-7-deazaguanine synthase QueE n=1 Tax=Streptomyces sp. PKU-EA00015 TaxID=2748326 RepID=UPI0015A213D5|nr:7-carboxy-7-deazaguanine synthase QueE [Streptomyces sp. PKU-EA00015]NWF31173.1 7-carboxy-7-deazaguanine synthase QueE [Streptomyces sp. PKU-EA00015]
MTTPTLVVSEVFGPTVQGEGPSTGRRASFIRLGGCNLHCSWCDTPYTWDGSSHDLRTELTRTLVVDLAARALEGAPQLVVLTGGEPLLHQYQPGWAELLAALTVAGVEVEVETNGTIAPTAATTAAVARFNVSPKLAHAGDPEHIRLRPRAIAALRATGRAAFKFVCATKGDVDEAAAHAAAWGLPLSTVWVMPEGTDPVTLSHHLNAIADPAIGHGFNLTTRLHVLAWGNERAR